MPAWKDTRSSGHAADLRGTGWIRREFSHLRCVCSFLSPVKQSRPHHWRTGTWRHRGLLAWKSAVPFRAHDVRSCSFLHLASCSGQPSFCVLEKTSSPEPRAATKALPTMLCTDGADAPPAPPTATVTVRRGSSVSGTRDQGLSGGFRALPHACLPLPLTAQRPGLPPK